MKIFSQYKTFFGLPGPRLKTTGEEQKGSRKERKKTAMPTLSGNLSLFPN